MVSKVPTVTPKQTAAAVASPHKTNRHTHRPIKPRENHHRKKLQELWARSAGMPAPPEEFDVEKYYRVKLLRTVMPKDHTKPLRPQQEVIVRGDVANEIKEHIHSAKAV